MAFIATTLVILVAYYVTYGGPILAVFGLGLSAWLFTAVLTEFAERVRLFRIPLVDSMRRAIHLPRSAYGMTIAHLGLAVSVAGFSVDDFVQCAANVDAFIGDSEAPRSRRPSTRVAIAKAMSPNVSHIRMP